MAQQYIGKRLCKETIQVAKTTFENIKPPLEEIITLVGLCQSDVKF